MQRVSAALFDLFRVVSEEVTVGWTTAAIDRLVRRFLQKHGMVSALVSYRGYPAHASVSVNEVAVHGVPGERSIRRGDTFTVDVAARGSGFVADTAWTFWTPGCSRRSVTTIENAWRAFRELLVTLGPGVPIRRIGVFATEIAARNGVSIVPEFVGHGIGRELHEPPMIPFSVSGEHEPTQGDLRLRPGMIVNIEPVFSTGNTAIEALDDGWGYRLVDGGRSVHFELSVLIDESGCTVLQMGGASVDELPDRPPFGLIRDAGETD